MDFDTIHGTSLTDPSKPLVLYWNRQAAVEHYQKHNRFVLFTLMVFVPAVWFLMLSFIHFFIHPFSSTDVFVFAMLSLVIPLMAIPACFSTSRNIVDDLSKTMTPVIELSSEGLSVRCPGRNFGVVPWSFVNDAQIHCLKLFPGAKEERFVRIVFSSYSAVKEYKLEDDSYMGQYHLAPEDYEKWRIERSLIKLPPPKNEDYCVDIPESWLPLSAEDVVEAVRLRLVHLINAENDSLAIDG